VIIDFSLVAKTSNETPLNCLAFDSFDLTIIISISQIIFKFAISTNVSLYLKLVTLMILQENNLPPMRFHDLKHTFVSILIGQGIPTADVQQLARHTSYQTTIDIYRHLLPNQLEKGLHNFDLMLLSVEKS